MNPVETGFIAMVEIRATSGGGVQETACYPTQINRLNAGSAMLKPQVLAVSQLQNAGVSPRMLGCSPSVS